eukprot:928213-Prymnesium_polylepis.1
MWLSAGRPSLPESRAAQISHIGYRASRRDSSIEGGWRWWNGAQERAWPASPDDHCHSYTARL